VGCPRAPKHMSDSKAPSSGPLHTGAHFGLPPLTPIHHIYKRHIAWPPLPPPISGKLHICRGHIWAAPTASPIPGYLHMYRGHISATPTAPPFSRHLHFYRGHIWAAPTAPSKSGHLHTYPKHMSSCPPNQTCVRAKPKLLSNTRTPSPLGFHSQQQLPSSVRHIVDQPQHNTKPPRSPRSQRCPANQGLNC
jgi:hypothetical protein